MRSNNLGSGPAVAGNKHEWLWSYRVPLLCLAIWGVVNTIQAFSTGITLVSWPLSYFWGDQSGGSQLNFALYIAKGLNFFTDARAYPMLTPQTPGFFPLLIAPAVKWFGPQLLYGNLLGFLSLLLTLACTYYLGFKKTKSHWAALSTLGLLLSIPRFGSTFMLNRPDSLAVALSLLSTVAVFKALLSAGQKRIGWIAFGAVMMVAACYTKQLSITVFIGTILYLFLYFRKSVLCYLYTAIFLIISLLILVILQIKTSGGFLTCILTYARQMTSFDWRHWLSSIVLFSVGMLPILTLIGLELVAEFQEKRVDLFVVLFIASLAIGIATTWQTGGSFQYFGWAVAFGAICSMVRMHTLLRLSAQSLDPSRLIIFALVLPVIAWPLTLRIISPWLTLRQGWTEVFAESDPHYRSQAKDIQHLLNRLDGEVLTTSLTGLQVLSGQDVIVETHALGLIAEKGTWDPAILVSDLRRGRWKWVLAFDTDVQAFENSRILDEAFRQGYRMTGERYPLGERMLFIWQCRECL